MVRRIRTFFFQTWITCLWFLDDNDRLASRPRSNEICIGRGIQANDRTIECGSQMKNAGVGCHYASSIRQNGCRSDNVVFPRNNMDTLELVG